MCGDDFNPWTNWIGPVGMCFYHMLQFHWLLLWCRLTQNRHLGISVLARPLSEGTVPFVELCPLPTLCSLITLVTTWNTWLGKASLGFLMLWISLCTLLTQISGQNTAGCPIKLIWLYYSQSWDVQCNLVPCSSLQSTDDGIVCLFPACWFHFTKACIDDNTCFDHHGY